MKKTVADEAFILRAKQRVLAAKEVRELPEALFANESFTLLDSDVRPLAVPADAQSGREHDGIEAGAQAA